MSYTVVGDSLIQHYEYHDTICYPGMTLEFFVSNPSDELLSHLNTEYIFCFGANDLAMGIPEDKVIENYLVLKEQNKKYKKWCLILPPLQTTSFYEKCINKLNCSFITTFMMDYKTIDGIHPTDHTLTQLRFDIENV
jgi:hypothetical protein